MRSVEIHDGAYHYPEALSLEEQKSLLEIFQKSKAQIYKPRLKSGHYMNLDMTCFGKHWSAKDYQYHDSRVDFDQENVESLPVILIDLAKKFAEEYFARYNLTWDIALMNYYSASSTLGNHQDNSESKETMNAGHPVVSFSIGADSIFTLGGITRKEEYQDILLKGGDVFLFGGHSRMRYHGIKRIIPTDNPFSKDLENGRVNFTLRKY